VHCFDRHLSGAQLNSGRTTSETEREIAMSTPYIGQITMFGGNFAPINYAFCNGQPIAISDNETLYNLIGTTFGGDGVNTFNLPDLQCRLPVHQGQAPGLSNYVLGQKAGSENVTITQSTMPAHSHTFVASTANATAAAIGTGENLVPATPTVSNASAYAVSGPLTLLQTLAPGTCGLAGNSLPHSNMMPSLCITFVIALYGVYPSPN
jgi:microcystin-dependent protein